MIFKPSNEHPGAWLRHPLLIVICTFMVACGSPAPTHSTREGASDAPTVSLDAAELTRIFEDVEGTFVLLDAQTGRILRHSPERARTPFSPASTFKIPNTLIALETGVASGPDFGLARDPRIAPAKPWWPEAWTQNHTLGTAFKNSVVWYYQELARRIGLARMQTYVDQFDYGNRDISGGIDRFWLSGGLRTTAEEQVEFLRRFYEGKLGLSKQTTATAKTLFIIEQTPQYRLSGKTGWAGFGEPGVTEIGWFSGYLERGDEVYFFALNMDMRRPKDATARVALVKSVLRKAGLL